MSASGLGRVKAPWRKHRRAAISGKVDRWMNSDVPATEFAGKGSKCRIRDLNRELQLRRTAGKSRPKPPIASV